MDKEFPVTVAIGVDYRRVVILPLAEAEPFLRALTHCAYEVQGYGKDRGYLRISAAASPPSLEIVTPSQLLAARTMPPVSED